MDWEVYLGLMDSRTELRRFSRLAGGVAVVCIVIGLLFWPIIGQANWAIVLVNFSYFTGITWAILVLGIILRITSARWGAYLYRLAATVTTSFLPAAAALLLVVIVSQFAVFYWTEESHNFYLNSTFFTARNVLYFILLYGVARAIFNASKPQKLSTASAINNRLLLLGFAFIVLYVYGGTMFFWDFGMMLYPHFTSTIYSLFTLAASLYGGIAALILMIAFLRRYAGATLFTDEHVKNLGTLMLGFVPVWLWLWGAEGYIIYFVNIAEETEPFYLRIFSEHLPTYVAMVFLTLVIPFHLLIWRKVRNNPRYITMIAVFPLLGLWLQRYLQVTPALVEEGRSASISLIHPANFIFTLGILTAFLFLLFRALSKYPEALHAAEETVLEEDLVITQAQGWR